MLKKKINFKDWKTKLDNWVIVLDKTDLNYVVEQVYPDLGIMVWKYIGNNKNKDKYVVVNMKNLQIKNFLDVDNIKKFNFIDKNGDILLNEWIKLDANLEIVEHWLSKGQIAIKFLNKDNNKIFYVFKDIK